MLVRRTCVLAVVAAVCVAAAIPSASASAPERQSGSVEAGASGERWPAGPPGMTLRRASYLARRAIRLRTSYKPYGLRTACERDDKTKFTCGVGWRRGRDRYRGSIVVYWLVENDELRWYHRLNVTRTRSRCDDDENARCSSRIRGTKLGGVLPNG